jgi:DMSO reductase anchor subunit
MNAAYIHITLNTIAPILNVTALLIFLVGLMRKNGSITRTALVLMLAVSVIAIPTYLSGEPAEDIVEKIEGVNAAAIEPHEEAGKIALIIFIIQGVAVLAALIVAAKGTVPQWLTAIVLLVALIATGAVFRTAFLGGRIHHPETQMKGARP